MYNKQFYERCIRKYGAFSKEVIPLLINMFSPKSVIDIGCGAGMYIKAFYDYNIDVIGYEGSVDALKYGLLPDKVVIHNFEELLVLDKKYDLCMSVEVAEHIPEDKSNNIVDTLCNASDTVLFTAAKPGQFGTGHVNCQEEVYWVEKFSNHGYTFDIESRDKLRKDIKLLSSFTLNNFFYLNLLIFRKDGM